MSTERPEIRFVNGGTGAPLVKMVYSRRTLLRVFAAIAAFAGLAGLAWWRSGADLRQVMEVLQQVHWGYVVMAFAAYYGSFPLRAWRWHRLLSHLPSYAPPIRPFHLVRLYLYGWLVNCALPAKVGELYRSYLVHQRLQTPLGAIIGTVLIERTADFLFLAALFPLAAVLALGTHLGGSLLLLQLIALFASIALVTGLFALRRLERFLVILPAFLHRPAQTLSSGLSLDQHTSIAVGLSTLPLWLLEGLRVYAECRALHLFLSPPLTLLVALVAALLTTIPLTPAGLGAVELGIASTLALLGIPIEQAIALALLDRFVAYWSVFPVAGVPWLIDHLRGS